MSTSVTTSGGVRCCLGMPNDRAIVDGLLRGDERAFDAAFAAYRPRVYGFLLRLAGRADTAEELLQETFLRLAAHGRRLREDTDLRAWLFAVARNLWRSHRRWAWLDGERLAELAARALSRPTRPDTPLALVEADEQVARLEAALAAMPEAHREAFWLVCVEGMEPQQAADVVGVRADALRQRLARARAAAAEALADVEPRKERGGRHG